jgi:streptogramin lyase
MNWRSRCLCLWIGVDESDTPSYTSLHAQLCMWPGEGEERVFTILRSKKLLLSLIVLPTLIASLAFTFGAVHPSLAASALSSVTDYQIPSGLDPWGTAFDNNDNVWVAVPGCNPNPDCGSRTSPGKIEVFSSTSFSWTTYQLPSGYGQALFLAFDGSGNLWFPMFHTNTLGEMLATDHSFHYWPMPTPASGPWDIAIDHNGYIWITEHYVNKIARFDPTSHSFTEVATPATNSQPYGITVDAYNNIWFTENNSAVALIGEYNTTSNQLAEYKIRTGSTTNLTPHLITVAPDGNIWWTEGFAGMIGELNMSNQVVKEYTYPHTCKGCGTHASGISVDSNGLIWFDDSLQNTFGSFSDSGNGTFSMYNAPSSRSHPHDGLRVDSSNRIWFDEQYAEKLAVAVQS